MNLAAGLTKRVGEDGFGYMVKNGVWQDMSKPKYYDLYNWALTEWQKSYEAGGKPNEAGLRRQLNAVKAAEFPWMKDVTKCAPQMAVKDLGKAFQNFFAKRSGYPKLPAKGSSNFWMIMIKCTRQSGHLKLHQKKARELLKDMTKN